jgi:hypothetical protein
MDEMKKAGFFPSRGVPEEGTQKGNQLRRQAQRKRTKELRAGRYRSVSHRLDPDERFTGSRTTRPRYEMNEFSCYDCMKPIKTEKQLNNHMNGRDHRNVVDYRTRTEKGYVPDRGKSYCGAALPSRQHGRETQPKKKRIQSFERSYRDWFDECGFRDDHDRPVSCHMALPSKGHHNDPGMGREGPPNSRERHTSHRAFRVNEYCGPGPDCDSSNHDQEPPDDPCMGMYSIPAIPAHELGSVASLINGKERTTHELSREYPDKLQMLKDG